MSLNVDFRRLYITRHRDLGTSITRIVCCLPTVGSNEGVGQHNFLESPRDLAITQGVLTRAKLGNLIKCRLKLKAKETLQCKRVSYRPQIRLQIDQVSIKIESSRNITNLSAIDPKVRPVVRLQMATSVCVLDFKLIKCQL